MVNEQLVNTLANSNLAYTNESALNMRLSTDALLWNLEMNLKGIKLVPNKPNKQGVQTSRQVRIGDKKMNDVGVQSIMMFFATVVNNVTVQGNWDREGFLQTLYLERRNMSLRLVENCNQWEIKEEYLELICDMIMLTLKCFLSRLIDNKERDSYSNTVSVKEVNTLTQGPGVKV